MRIVFSLGVAAVHLHDVPRAKQRTPSIPSPQTPGSPRSHSHERGLPGPSPAEAHIRATRRPAAGHECGTRLGGPNQRLSDMAAARSRPISLLGGSESQRLEREHPRSCVLLDSAHPLPPLAQVRTWECRLGRRQHLPGDAPCLSDPAAQHPPDALPSIP